MRVMPGLLLVVRRRRNDERLEGGFLLGGREVAYLFVSSSNTRAFEGREDAIRIDGSEGEPCAFA